MATDKDSPAQESSSAKLLACDLYINIGSSDNAQLLGVGKRLSIGFSLPGGGKDPERGDYRRRELSGICVSLYGGKGPEYPENFKNSPQKK